VSDSLRPALKPVPSTRVSDHEKRKFVQQILESFKQMRALK